MNNDNRFSPLLWRKADSWSTGPPKAHRQPGSENCRPHSASSAAMPCSAPQSPRSRNRSTYSNTAIVSSCRCVCCCVCCCTCCCCGAPSPDAAAAAAIVVAKICLLHALVNAAALLLCAAAAAAVCRAWPLPRAAASLGGRNATPGLPPRPTQPSPPAPACGGSSADGPACGDGSLAALLALLA